MADDFTDLLDVKAVDNQDYPLEISDFPQTLVTEKIIFVVDILLLEDEDDRCSNITNILSALKLHFSLKKKTSVKPPKFECMLYNKNAILQYNINSEKNLNEAFLTISNAYHDDDREPLKINEVFDKIAASVELPDADSLKKCLPPNWMYHVIWLFGRNLHIPTMQNTNSFDFLMMTPYFALDILYLFDQNLPDSLCEQISEALCGLNENRKGYFLSSSVHNKDLYPLMAQFLGHPLIRIPQIRARYNITELYDNLEGEINIKNNNDEE